MFCCSVKTVVIPFSVDVGSVVGRQGERAPVQSVPKQAPHHGGHPGERGEGEESCTIHRVGPGPTHATSDDIPTVHPTKWMILRVHNRNTSINVTMCPLKTYWQRKDPRPEGSDDMSSIILVVVQVFYLFVKASLHSPQQRPTKTRHSTVGCLVYNIWKDNCHFHTAPTNANRQITPDQRNPTTVDIYLASVNSP